jgi:polar amino acid transport system permease protein
LRRSTRRRLSLGIQYALFVAVVVLLILIADWEAVRANFLDTEVLPQLWPEIVTVAAKNTIIYTAIAFAGGLAIGVVMALMRLSPVLPYRWAARAYIEFFRGLPALLVIIAFGFAIPIAFQWRPPGGTTGAGVVALMVVAGAYMAETIRAGIQAVPKGQAEAARSLGMSSSRTMLSIVLPQAFRIVVPPLTNELVLLLKDTSLLYVIGMALDERELTTFGRAAQSQYADSSPLVAAAVMYLVITLPLTQLVSYLERRQQKAR